MSHRTLTIGRALAAAVLGLVPASALHAADGADAAPSACQLRLSPHAVFRPLGTLVGPARGPAGCGASDAVLLQRVILDDLTEVAVEPPATVRCEMAEAVAEFVRGGLVPAAGALGAPLTAIGNHDSYECRGRNRVPGAKLSEHGTANALDIRSVTLADGRVVLPADPAAPPDFRTAMKTAACERFTTVLGPGSDGYHEDHIHIDHIERRSGVRLCRWELGDEPRYALQAVPKGSGTKGSDTKGSDTTKRSDAAPARLTTVAFAGPIPLPRPRPFDAPPVTPANRSR